MLHIFHVEPGTMITLDMDLALESVAAVKEHIKLYCGIPVDKQVLLVSGGESLDDANRVCSYSAGTDTSPIFLFSVCAIEAGTPPSASVDYGSDPDLSARVALMRALPVAQATVAQRTQLAVQAHEAARELVRSCKQLVDEQHLQLQGWAAVVANLEDLNAAYRRKAGAYRRAFDDYLGQRVGHLDFMQHFHDDLLILSKIPIVSVLLEAEIAAKEVDGEDINGSANSKSEENAESKALTLFDWISSTDSKNAMEQLFEHCKQGLEQINEESIDTLYKEITKVINSSNDVKYKEVQGLRERLLGLEQLYDEAKRLVQEQADLSQSFQRNQKNPNLGDMSVLPDLCASHKEQLNVLLNNHIRLCDIKRRCIKAKNELSVLIYHRLKWVQHVQNSITISNNKQMMYFENLKRLRQHLLIMQQIHLAPATYLTAVAEVVRRRSFSQAFLLWASELACHLLTIHNDELGRRRDFHTIFHGHFLTSLFPGMEDQPPDYGTQAPGVFDAALPPLTTEDVAHLRAELARLDATEVPHLEQLMEALEGVGVAGSGGRGEEFNSTLAHLLLVRSRLKTELISDGEDAGKEEDKEDEDVKVVSDTETADNVNEDDGTSKPSVCTTLPQPTVAHLKDWDKGCESETDTEEFEKLCQSPAEPQLTEDPRRPESASTRHDAATSTEDNLHSSRLAYTTQQALLSKLFLLSTQGLVQLRSDLAQIKSLYLSSRSSMSSIEQHVVESLSSSWENLAVEREGKEREVVHRMSLEHEAIVEGLRGEMEELRSEVVVLVEEKGRVRTELEELQLENSNLQKRHEKQLHEKVDEMKHEHKAEMENLRVRFRLMSAEAETSDDALSKLRKQLAEEKEKALVQAVLQETQSWTERMDSARREWQLRMDDEIGQINEQKEKQIKRLLERENNLQLECIKYKTSLQQLAESETEARNVELQERIECLEQELVEERSRRGMDVVPEELTGSVAPYDGKMDAATSPIHSRPSSTSTSTKQPLTRSQTALVRSARLSIDSCTSGDHVLVLWDTEHDSYIVLQRSAVQHFLHSDCVEELGLGTGTGVGGRKAGGGGSGGGSGGADGGRRQQYCVGEVLDKEYCNALKRENRYKVPKGTKFYRVKVKHIEPPPKDSLTKSQTNQPQQTMSQSQAPSTSSAQTAQALHPTSSAATYAQVMCQSLPSSLTDGVLAEQQAPLEAPDTLATDGASAVSSQQLGTDGAAGTDGGGSSFDEISASEASNR